MRGNMVIEIPAKDSMTTKLVVLDCPLTIFGKHFGVDLVCLPLRGMDVILGMNWLRFNKVHIDCLNGTVVFPEPNVNENLETVTAGQVKKLMNEDAMVFMICAALITEEETGIANYPLLVNFQMCSLMTSATCHLKEKSNSPLMWCQALNQYPWRLIECLRRN
jgi:hypothetical protein